MVDEQTARERWEAIPHQFRLIGLLALLYFWGGVAIVIRPDNPIADYWLEIANLQADGMGLLFIGSSLSMPVVYYLTRRLFSVALFSLPVLITLALLMMQVITASDDALLILWLAASVIILVGVLFYLTTELDAERRANQALGAELASKDS